MTDLEYDDDISNDILDAMDEVGFEEPSQIAKSEKEPEAVDDDGDEAEEPAELEQEASDDTDLDDKPGEKPEREANADNSTPIPAPASMSSADIESFQKLPSELQQWISSREKQRDQEWQRKTYELARDRERFKGIDQAFAPIDQALQLQGQSREQYISSLIAADRMLHQSPVQAMLALCQMKGIDPRMLSQQPNGAEGQGIQQHGQPQQIFDPRYNQIMQTLQGVQTQQQQWQQSLAQQQQARLSGLIESFRNASDESGKQLHPYFDEVREAMAPLVDSLEKRGVAPDQALQKAYEQAVWSQPNTRAAMLEQQRKQQEAEARARAEQARKAAQSKRTMSASRQPEEVPDDIFEALSQAWDQSAA